MTKKTRFIILFVCILCFLIIAPVLVSYSMGYRFDFEKMKITLTGGIYVRTFPTADKITIDSKISDKPGFLANSIFVQSLLPKNHTVLIMKNGYYDYYKTLIVQEKQVTKLENVVLFKKDLKFSVVTDKTISPFSVQEKYLIKNSNLYYSNALENANISATQKATPILKNLVAFKTINNNMIWLGADGFLYQRSITDLPLKTGTVAEKLNLTALKINKKDVYKIIADGQSIFLNDSEKLFMFDNKKKDLVAFADSVKDAKLSPDSKNLSYSANNKIYLYTISDDPSRSYLQADKTTSLNELENTSNSIFWINNDYIIFTSGSKIVISEIDYRGNVNSITLPQIADKISFNQQTGKLYILSGTSVLVSDKLIP